MFGWCCETKAGKLMFIYYNSSVRFLGIFSKQGNHLGLYLHAFHLSKINGCVKVGFTVHGLIRNPGFKPCCAT